MSKPDRLMNALNWILTATVFALAGLMILSLAGCATGGLNYKGVQVTLMQKSEIDGDGNRNQQDSDADEVPDHQQGSDILVPLASVIVDGYLEKLKVYESLIEQCLESGRNVVECQGAITPPEMPEIPVQPPVEPPITPDPPIEPGKPRISHYNTASWDGRGTSIILCEGDTADSVSIGDNALRLHGSLDHGREVWTNGINDGTPNMLGLAEVRFTNGDVERFDINVANSVVRGDCG